MQQEVFAGRVMLEVACPQPLDAQLALENVPGVLEASVFGGTRLHVVVTEEEQGRQRTGEVRLPRRLPRRVHQSASSRRSMTSSSIASRPKGDAHGAGSRGMNLRKIWAMAKKESRQTSRDP